MSRRQLTTRQEEVISVIRDLIAEYGYSPTFREIGARLGITSKGVIDHLRAIRKKVAITYIDYSPRTVRIIGAEK